MLWMHLGGLRGCVRVERVERVCEGVRGCWEVYLICHLEFTPSFQRCDA